MVHVDSGIKIDDPLQNPENSDIKTVVVEDVKTFTQLEDGESVMEIDDVNSK